MKTYIMMLFGISVALYLLGYTSPFLEVLNQTGVDSSTGEASASNFWDYFINKFLETFTSKEFLATMAIPIVGSILLSGSSGQSGYFVIPILFLTVMANFFILPTTFIFSAELPAILKVLINSFLNLFLLLTIVEFVTGRS